MLLFCRRRQQYNITRLKDFNILNEFFISNPLDGCTGSWTTGCDGNGDNCLYKATWMVLGDISSVFFAVEVRTTGWVGIGFSRNDKMVQLIS